MNRKIVSFIMMAVITLANAGFLWADFEDTGAGSRAIGMGNAFTAVADDPFGIYYNPAGLGFMRTSQVGADFGRLYLGLDDNSSLMTGFTAIAVPILTTKLADTSVAASSGSLAGISSATVSGADASTGTVKAAYSFHIGTFALGLRYFTLVDTYQESAYYLSFARSIRNRWSWGASIKYLQEKYVMDDYLRLSPVFQYGKKDSVQNLSLDLGFMYNIAPRFFLGASLLDINQPNMGLKETDQIPYTGRIGIAWKERGLCWALDAVTRRNQWYYSTGFEKYLTNLFALRVGLGIGGHNYFNIAGGFTVNLYRAQLDYVFQYPLSGIRDISGTHRMSLIFRFGRRMTEEMEVGSIEYYYSRLRDELENVSARLTETKGEKENLEKILVEEATLRIQERINAAKAAARYSSTSTPAPAPKVTVTESKEPKETKHLVRKGETLQSIAEKYYGATKFWDEIYQANKENVGRGGVLKPNQVLIIPQLAKQDTGGSAEPAAPAAKAAKTEESAQRAEPAQPKDGGIKVIAASQPGALKPVDINAPGEKVVPVKVVTPSSRPMVSAVSGNLVPEKVTPVKGAAATGPAVLKQQREAARPAPAQAKAVTGRRHVVQQGENLRSIAQKYYNDSNRWKDIYQANKSKVIGGQVTPGQEIIVP